MRKRILMLDDNQDMLNVIREALSYEKFEVNVAAGGDEVIEAAKIFNPDLIILDYKLKDYNGADVCRQIKTDPLLNDIPVMICSAYLNTDTDLRAYGCDAIIVKPFGLEELIDKVNRLIAV